MDKDKHGPTRRLAFTLMELVVSLGVTGIVLGGLTSVVVLATHAIPSAESAPEATVNGGEIANQIAGELRYALSFTTRTNRRVDFQIPDRTGDAAPESLSYDWSGLPGDPLTRQYNGGPQVEVLPSATDFDLSYHTRSATTTESITSTNSTSLLLASFEAWTGLTPTPFDYGVNATTWIVEYFNAVSLPTNASRLTITRVEIMLQQGSLGSSGTVKVAIHPVVAAGNPQPQTSPIGTPSSMSGALLPATYEWREFLFSDVVINSPGQEFVIVIKGLSTSSSSSDAKILRYNNNSAPANDAIALWTTNSGGSYSPVTSKRNQYDVPFRIYGIYETSETTQQDVTRHYLDGVGITLQTAADPATAVHTGTQVLNAPEVAAP